MTETHTLLSVNIVTACTIIARTRIGHPFNNLEYHQISTARLFENMLALQSPTQS